MNRAEGTEKSLAMNDLTQAIKLSINRRLFEKGCITEEMYIRAKELIIKKSA